ncbi:MAG TPA: glucose 1-dehydrogenase [Roseiarcus sp.]|nr:glucose 1-dehydrogenase [Roseiarcus sp.]
MSKPRLEGKVALITGAAGGIGSASAALFEAEGAKLALTDLDVASLAPFAERGALVLSQDVTDEAGWREVVEAAIARFGRLDVLVNNAGVAILGNIETATVADWRKTQAVNAESVFLGCREAVRAMKGQGGSIVNISSVAGLIGDAQSVAYCASKGAVRLTTKSVALYCARKGYRIRCNSVHPSFTRTNMVEGFIATARNPERVREGLAAAAPLGRMGEAAEIAAAILYLASDESAFTTGAEMVVDGGLTAQ